MILDTSFLIDLFSGQPPAFEKGRELAAAETIQRVPSPVVTELSYGAGFGDETDRRNVQNAVQMYPIVEQTEQLAYRAGQLLAMADRQADGDSGIDNIDPMVAAVAERYDESSHRQCRGFRNTRCHRRTVLSEQAGATATYLPPRQRD